MQASIFLPRSSQFLLRTFLLTIVLFVPSLVRAQAYFGTVSGALMDASGAVLVLAKPFASALTEYQSGRDGSEQIALIGVRGW
jgi:hypothetical protein